jgi:glyoxylase-like metal-dependent hydrolase (beta-lactamase superfamily II)
MPERLRVGAAEIAVARDADYRLAAGRFLRDASGSEIAPDAFRPYLGDADPMAYEESQVLTYVVRSEGKTILVDAGVGLWGIWRFGDGHLLDSLAALDLTPADVDYVLPTHLHMDHVGWNTRPSADGPVPTFPRARYLFQQADWEHFTAPGFLQGEGPLVEMVHKAVLPLEPTGLMDLIGPEYAVTEEVTLLHTPGHTPGSVCVLIQSQGEAALLVGDAAHHPLQLTQTDWSPLVDVDASLSARSREALVREARRRDAYIAGGHFLAADPTFGKLIEVEGRPVWRGVTLSPS